MLRQADPSNDGTRDGGKTRRRRQTKMSNQMQSEIAELNLQIEALDDPREGYALVQDRIRLYRQTGGSVPEDLKLMERRLATECLCESQGR